MFVDGKFVLPTDVPTVPKEIVVPKQVQLNQQLKQQLTWLPTNMDKQNLVPSKFEGFRILGTSQYNKTNR